MQDAQGSDASFQLDDLNYNYRSIVSDLEALIRHVQASIRLIESTIVRDSLPGEQEVATDVAVLDDVTPCYEKASAALNTCNASLGVALHFLLDGLTPHHETDERAGYDRRPLHPVARAEGTSPKRENRLSNRTVL